MYSLSGKKPYNIDQNLKINATIAIDGIQCWNMRTTTDSGAAKTKVFAKFLARLGESIGHIQLLLQSKISILTKQPKFGP